MRRGAKPAKAKVEAKPPAARKSRKDEGSKVRDLEKRLAEALGQLETRNRELVEAQEQQTATSEILRVISNSPTDLQPVLDAVAANAARLCEALDTVIRLRHGDELRLAAHHGPIPVVDTIPVARGLGAGRAVLERRTVHIHDGWAEAAEFPEGREFARRLGFRTALTVPLLREGTAIGTIQIRRPEVRPFTDEQIGLLQTFADQAVIAIENVRLFKELEERNGELSEALEQQTATSEILRVISSSPTDVQPVFDAIATNAARLCDAVNGLVIRFDGQLLHLAAQYNVDPERLAAVKQAYPRPPDRGALSGRAILTRDVVHVPDVSKDPEYTLPAATTIGYRSVLAVPMMHEGVPRGTILVARDVVAPFSDTHIALIRTFADQAVIAIENVRLFTELQSSNSELRVALEQQTATSEVLKVIGRSTFDLQPVFETLAENAIRLCEAERAFVHRFDGQYLRVVATHNVAPELRTFVERNPIAPGRQNASARAALERRIVHIHDAQADPEFTYAVGVDPIRTVLAIPMLRAGELLGVIVIYRHEVLPFTASQIALMETFGDQAAIAIENVRLFNETKEALERQTATSEILRVISSSPTDIQPVLDSVAASSMRLTSSEDAAIFLVEGDVVRLAAHQGPFGVGSGVREFTMAVGQGTVCGRSVLERRTIHLRDQQEADLEYPEGAAYARAFGHRALLAVPLLREGMAIGVLQVRRPEPITYTDQQIALLETFADQAVIAIENVRLFKELEARNQELTVALAQQTATSEVLAVISGAQADVQPVFEAIVQSARRLCNASYSSVYRLAGQLVHLVAHNHQTPEAAETFRAAWPMPLTGDSFVVRAIRENAVIHTDMQEDPATSAALLTRAKAVGHRRILVVPMVREGQPIGGIRVSRAAATPFAEHHIALLQTFADQAVIAIENVRLFTELQARTQDLTRSVGQLTALGEVGRAVSSTLDLETVLSTIVSRAIQLSGTDGGSVYEYDEATEEFSLRASRDLPEAYVEQVRDTRPRKGEGAVGRVAQTREPVQIADISDPAAYESRVRQTLLHIGLRALLAVPLIAEDQLVGALIVMRKRTGAFAAEEVTLLQTFATQSALAIQNARLFREIEDKSRQLEVASQHKSEFLANMSHELRTPLNAIIGFSEVLSERMFGELNEKQEEYLKDIYASGTHLLSLINDILDLSKIEAGRMELELTDFDLPTALDNALTLVRERAGRRSITLQTSVDERLGEIRADERKVRQVVLNLLSNAIKFTPEGGSIEVRAVPKAGFVEVSVSDTGVGIAPEDQEAVFEEFRQVGTADKKVEGTGLGLTLCRKFVELHGGRIWVKSQVGAGSTFTFTIPVRRSE
jgi:GAF domain-containing protein